MVTWETVREILAALPETDEGTSYGTPAFRVRKKLLVRLREDGETLVVHGGAAMRAALLAADEPAFFTLPHYDGPDSPYVLVRLPSVAVAELRDVLTDAWAYRAPEKVVAAWRADRGDQDDGAS